MHPIVFEAAIFDFDGVVVDSGPLHERAWIQVAKERSQPITHEIFLKGFGVKNALFIRDMLKWSQDPNEIEKIIDRKEELFQSYLKTDELHIVPGVDTYVRELKRKGILVALGSSSIRKNIILVLAKLQLEDLFEVIISGENVTHGKPDPEVFLNAAKALNMAPSKCCVFEDAPLGIEAALRAGMKVIALTTTFSKEHLSTLNPDAIWDSFSS